MKLRNLSKFLLLGLFITCSQRVLSESCFEVLKSNGYEYKRVPINEKEEAYKLDEFRRLRHQAFPHIIQKIEVDNRPSNFRRIIRDLNHPYYETSWDMPPITSVSGVIKHKDKEYNCEFGYKRYIKCGPFVFLHGRTSSQDSFSFDLPYGWNQTLTEVFDKFYFNEQPYYAVGANNGAFFTFDSEPSEFNLMGYQPKFPKFPETPYGASLTFITFKDSGKLSLLPFTKGGWEKSVKKCSPGGETISYVSKAILIPIRKYQSFVERWEDSISIQSSFGGKIVRYRCPESDASCINNLPVISNALTSLLSRDDILTISMEMKINAEVEKLDLSF